MPETICRGWVRCELNGEITGGCGSCRRCFDAAQEYLRRSMQHGRDLRNAANQLLKELETGYEIPKPSKLDELIGSMGKAIRAGRRIHDRMEGDPDA